MEDYTPFGHSDYQTIVAEDQEVRRGRQACVLSTINGDSNVPFYKELGNAGLKATDVPVVAFSVGEEELRGVDTKPLVGHLAAWNYFKSLKNPENEKFVKMYKDWAKKQKLPNAATVVTNDPMEATYIGIHMWKQAVEKAKSHRCRQGHRGDGRPDIQGAGRLQMKMDEKNHHLQKPVFIGEVKADGQFNVVWKTQGTGSRPAVEPVHRRQRQEEGRPGRQVGSDSPLTGNGDFGPRFFRPRRTADNNLPTVSSNSLTQHAARAHAALHKLRISLYS